MLNMKKILFTLIASAISASTLVAAPQAVVFDFGGVLTGKPNREAVTNFIQESLHLSKEEFDKLNEEKRLAIKQGKTDEEFWVSYAKASGIKLPSDWSYSLRSVMKDAIVVNPQMYALVEELKDMQMPVGLLSNIDERLAKLIRYFGFYEPFDPCLLSYEIGVEKPDLKAFEILLSELNLPAQSVVFIDDNAENVEAAKRMGIDAILFESEDQIRAELRDREIF